MEDERIRRFIQAKSASEKTDGNLFPVELTQKEADWLYERRITAMIDRIPKLTALAAAGQPIESDVVYQVLWRRSKMVEPSATQECRDRMDAKMIEALREHGMWEE